MKANDFNCCFVEKEAKSTEIHTKILIKKDGEILRNCKTPHYCQ